MEDPSNGINSTIWKGCNAFKRHPEVVFVKKSRGVVEELDVLREVEAFDTWKRFLWLTLIVTMDIVTGFVGERWGEDL